MTSLQHSNNYNSKTRNWDGGMSSTRAGGIESSVEWLMSLEPGARSLVLFGDSSAHEQSMMKVRSESVAGYAEHITRNLTDEIYSSTANEFITARIMRVVQAPESDRIKITEYEFAPQQIQTLPELAAPRLLMNRARSHVQHIRRRGIGLMMEDGYAMTAAGVRSYMYGMKQIADSVSLTINLDAIHALINASSNPSPAITYGVIKGQASRADVINAECDLFSMFTKTKYGGELALERARNIMTTRGYPPTAFIMPYNTLSALRKRPEMREAQLYSGGKAPQVFGDESYGVNIYEMRLFSSNQFEYQAEDPLVRTRIIGEHFPAYHRVNADLEDGAYRHKHRDIEIFDWDSDSMSRIRLRKMIDHCGLFDTSPSTGWTLTGLGDRFFSGFDTPLRYLTATGMYKEISRHFTQPRTTLTTLTAANDEKREKVDDATESRYTLIASKLAQKDPSKYRFADEKLRDSMVNKLTPLFERENTSANTIGHLKQEIPAIASIAVVLQDAKEYNGVDINKTFTHNVKAILTEARRVIDYKSKPKSKINPKGAQAVLHNEIGLGKDGGKKVGFAKVMQKLFDKDLPFPIDFDLQRPEMQFEMGSAIACVEGAVGYVAYGDPDCTIGHDNMRKSFNVHFTCRMGAIINERRMVTVLHNVAMRSYLRGGGTKLYHPYNDKDAVRNHTYTASIYVIAKYPNEDATPVQMDITGRFPDGFSLTEDDAQERDSYAMAEAYKEHWGWRSPHEYTKTSYKPEESLVYVNTVSVRGTAYYPRQNGQTYDPSGNCVLGAGHVGQEAYPGMKKDFLGESDDRAVRKNQRPCSNMSYITIV
jgi:hypothetical protein